MTSSSLDTSTIFNRKSDEYKRKYSWEFKTKKVKLLRRKIYWSLSLNIYFFIFFPFPCFSCIPNRILVDEIVIHDTN